MDITGLTWYFLISAILIVVGTFVFVGILINHFIKKRTIGTALLTISFICIALAELLNGTGLWYYVFGSQTSKVSGYLELNFTTMYSIAFLFLYYFANRHILKDNDIIKSVTSISLAVLTGVISTMLFTQLRDDNINSMYYTTLFMEGPNIMQYTPTMLSGLLLFVPIFLFVLLRIIIRLLLVRGKVDNPIAKSGFSFILYSMVSLVLAIIVASLFTIPGVGNSPVAITIIQTLRLLFNSIAIVFGYFGWILPDWLKRMIRGKAWIVKQIESQKVTKEKAYPFSSASIGNPQKDIVVEISDP
ncbi:MAG: hypothetical protein GF308_10475 [Candidatus Heimdallarchaeota archaeon]|nr:hypothetical protein [Candidatus Heimdallarchaeota archaeon]